MWSYAVKRVLLILPTLLGIAIATFLLLRVVPGDIVELKLRGDGGNVSQEFIERERARLGLDKPMAVQFADWLQGLPRGDFGTSLWTGNPVTVEIGPRLALSFQIAVVAALIATAVAVPLGIVSALHPNSPVDYLARFVTMFGQAVPAFWLAMLVIMALLALFDWMPSVSDVRFLDNPAAYLAQLFWPALTVGFRYTAVVARMVRSSLLEILREDFIRTARAKGLPERRVVWKHALRNALLPAVTIIGLEFAFLIGGLVVTEQVFNINGIGRLFLQAISHNDYTLVQGIVLVLAMIFLLTNLVVDLLYAALDPRVSYR